MHTKNDKLIITPKSESREEKTVTMTIRIDRELQDKFDVLAAKTNRTRNELINTALNFAVERIELAENNEGDDRLDSDTTDS